jgi:hypothetical protein
MNKINQKEKVFMGRRNTLKQKVVIHDLDNESYAMYDVSEAKCKFDADIYILCTERNDIITMGRTIAEPCFEF